MKQDIIFEKGGIMEVRIEKARELLRQLDMANGGSLIARAQRIQVVQEMLVETRQKLEIHY